MNVFLIPKQVMVQNSIDSVDFMKWEVNALFILGQRSTRGRWNFLPKSSQFLRGLCLGKILKTATNYLNLLLLLLK